MWKSCNSYVHFFAGVMPNSFGSSSGCALNPVKPVLAGGAWSKFPTAMLLFPLSRASRATTSATFLILTDIENAVLDVLESSVVVAAAGEVGGGPAAVVVGCCPTFQSK